MSNHTVTADYRARTAALSQLCFKLPAVEGKSKLQRHHIETFESSKSYSDQSRQVVLYYVYIIIVY
jgi:hypothetical protein